MKYSPDAPEFDWVKVQGREGVWRMGERITIDGDSSLGIIRYSVLGIVVVFYALSLLGLWNSFSSGDLDASGLAFGFLLRSLIGGGIFAFGLWYYAGRSTTIDWTNRVVTTRKAFVKRSFPLSKLTKVWLGKGTSKLLETSELRLFFDSASVQLVETDSQSRAEKRDAYLVTLGRRLSELLGVPFQTYGNTDAILALSLTNQELAAKYVEQGTWMTTHAEHAEMSGAEAAAKEYREEAIFYFQHAQSLDPDNADAILGMGRISGDQDYQLRAADLAVGESEDNVKGLLERGHLQQLAGNHESSEADFDRAVELERSAETLRARGVSLYFRGRFEHAKKDFEEAIEFSPRDAELHHWVADCWKAIFRRSRLERHRKFATEAARRAVDLEPDNSVYQADLRKLELEAGKNATQSLAEIDRLCEQNPDDYWLFKTRGEMILDGGRDLAKAVADFTRVIELMEKERESSSTKSLNDQMIAWMYRMRAEAYRADGDWSSADRDVEHADQLTAEGD